VAGEFATIEGDEVLLRQALSNLARNAFEACAGAQDPPEILIEGQVDRPQGLARLIVRDNGPGVAEENRTKIFQPFFTTKAQGTGLGLALVQRIIVTHSGRIQVGPGPSAGAAFTITLPISAPSE
jgi:signal transduction histidine kinase